MAFSEFVTSMGNRVECASHAKRIDAKIDDVGEISLKYSSGGNVTLHNVRSGINADFHVHPTIVLRPNGMYFLLEEELKKCTIELKDYLVDAKSSLELKQSIFKAIETHAPVLFIPLVIRSFKKECLRKNCFEVIYNGNAILTNPCLTDEEKKTQCLDLFTRYLSSPPK